MNKKDVTELGRTISDELNTLVYPKLYAALQENQRLRRTMNPAFPFPRKLRIGAISTDLVVEHVGPEILDQAHFDIEVTWNPDMSVHEFLGLGFDPKGQLSIPANGGVQNMEFFLGDASAVLGDYLYDIVLNPNDIMLNGYMELASPSEPTYVSNVSFLWADANKALRFKHLDFVELFPISDEGWSYHTEESLAQFAEFLLQLEVPAYDPALHGALNEFIRLVASNESETTLTSYLATHPQILQLALGSHDLNPQTDLVWQTGGTRPGLKPDFMPKRMDGYCDILEFKLPTFKSAPMVGAYPRSKPSAEVDAALAQIDEYEDWCSQEPNRLWLKNTKNILVHSPHTMLVMGRSDDFSAEDRQKLRGRRNATIVTYDEFIEMTRMQLYRIRQSCEASKALVQRRSSSCARRRPRRHCRYLRRRLPHRHLAHRRLPTSAS